MLRKMRGRLQRQVSARDLRTSELVRYQGVSMKSLESLWQEILADTQATGVQLMVLTSEAIEGTDRGSGDTVSLAGRTIRVQERDGDKCTGVVAYVEGEVEFDAASEAEPKPREDWTIEDVCEHVVLPATTAKGGCFWLDILPDQDVGKKHRGAFVSQARQCRFGDLVMALLEHFEGKDLSKEFVWLDIFSANQPRLTGADIKSPAVLAQRYELLTKHLHAAIERFDSRLIFFDSWLAPRALTRMWCVWEVYGAVRSNKPLELVFAPDQDDVFQQMVRNDPSAIPAALARFEMREARCHDETDQEMITNAVEALPGGFNTLNGAVLERLRAWLALTAKQMVLKQQQQGADELEAARFAHCVGQLTYLLGDMETAGRMFNHALEVKKRVLGDDHSDTLTSMHEVASVLESNGHYEEALELYKRILKQRIEQSGADSLATAVTMHSLATVLQTLGDLDRAEDLLEKVLKVKKAKLGPRHEQVAVTQHQLASVLQGKGKYTRARELYEEALDIKVEQQGPKHPNAVTTRYAIAQLLMEAGDLDEALELFEQVAATYREQLGEEHVFVATTLHEMAMCHLRRGDSEKALPLFQRALEIKKARLGRMHPNVAATMHEIALLMRESQPQLAADLLREAVEIKRATLGKNHEQVAVTMHEQALVLRGLGQLQEATKLFAKAADIKAKALGKRHPQVGVTLHEAGTTMMQAGQIANAVKVLLKALEIKRAAAQDVEAAQRAGDPDANPGQAWLNLAYTAHEAGVALGRKGDSARALQFMAEAAKIKTEQLGETHMQTAVTVHELGVLLARAGRKAEAREQFERSLKVFVDELGEDSGSAEAARSWLKEVSE